MNNSTEMVFILDRSGSMYGLEKDTIGGFNSMLKKQKKETGEAFITTVLFDHEIKLLHDHTDIKDVAFLTSKDYTVRGSTALLDAVGMTIKKIKNRQKQDQKEEIPDHTIFIIITDGMENASRKYTAEKVKQKISKMKEKYNWEFLFLGANIDAVQTAADFGISQDRSVNFISDTKGTGLNFKVFNQVVSNVRSYGSVPDDWKQEIDDDYKMRKDR